MYNELLLITKDDLYDSDSSYDDLINTDKTNIDMKRELTIVADHKYSKKIRTANKSKSTSNISRSKSQIVTVTKKQEKIVPLVISLYIYMYMYTFSLFRVRFFLLLS